jgi:hypothetical protein
MRDADRNRMSIATIVPRNLVAKGGIEPAGGVAPSEKTPAADSALHDARVSVRRARSSQGNDAPGGALPATPGMVKRVPPPDARLLLRRFGGVFSLRAKPRSYVCCRTDTQASCPHYMVDNTKQFLEMTWRE